MPRLAAWWLSALALVTLTVNATDVNNLRMWHAPDRTRVVLDLNAPVEFRSELLSAPDRLFVDLTGARFTGPLPDRRTLGPLIRGIRVGEPRTGTLRVVFDLNRVVSPQVFLLAPNQAYGYRLVIDLNQAIDGVARDGGAATGAGPGIVVVVDPGHGGEDHGAIGPGRTNEKDVVLSIARKIARRLDASPGFRAVLTRDGDYYVSLRERTDVARRHGAHLFISLHADAFKRQTARGSSVYALSQGGASSETARWLADKENAADLVGGVSLKDKDDLLAQVLLDLSMTRTIHDSLIFGRDVLTELKRVGPVHSARVEQAGFVVLKSPDIPSILVESAYISNPTEEKLLRSDTFQERVAEAVVRGVQRYMQRQPAVRKAGTGDGN